MKRTILYISFLLLLNACNKPTDFYNELGKSAYLTFVSAKTFLNGGDPAASVQLAVNATGTPVQSINLYVSAIATTDKTKWKLLKNVPFKGETTITATNTEVATALGLTPGNLTPQTVFYFYNEVVTVDGQHFSSANTSDADLENQVGFNTAMKWTGTVVCPYDASSVAGDYTVVQDDWQDWVPDDVVSVTAGPGDNQVNLSQVWPNPAFGNIVSPLVANVDPATGVLTIPANLVFGDYGTYKAVAISGNGFIFSCKDRIELTVHINALGIGDQGNSQLILQK